MKLSNLKNYLTASAKSIHGTSYGTIKVGGKYHVVNLSLSQVGKGFNRRKDAIKYVILLSR